MEAQLGAEIATKSHSFFASLATIRELEALMMSANRKIALLRSCLGDAKDMLADSSIEIHAKRDQAASTTQVLNILDLLASVSAAPNAIEQALVDADFVAAHQLIVSTKSLLDNDLRGVTAVAHLPHALDGYARQLADAVSAQFALLLRAAVSPESDALPSGTQVRALLVAAEAAGCRSLLGPVWRSELSSHLRSLVRATTEAEVSRIVATMGDRPDFDAASSLLDHLKAMDAPDYISVLEAIFDRAKGVLAGANLLLATVRDQVDALAPGGGGEGDPLLAELAEAVAAGAELVHARSAKLLAIRAGINAKLDFASFVALVRSVVSFIVQSEALVGHSCFGLRGPLLSQAKVFLSTLHETRMTKVGFLLEHEPWEPVDVPAHIQSRIPHGSGEGEGDGDGGGGDSSGETSFPALTVGDRAFKLCSVTILLFDIIQDYLATVEQLPTLAPDAITKLALLLKHFNSRACQLVLGAGAMHTAGLKGITAAHLAMVSQSLAALASYVPVLRDDLERVLPPKRVAVLNTLGEVETELEDHVEQVFAKIVAIMSDRVAGLVGDAPAVYSTLTPGASASSKPSGYAKKIVKSFAALSKVLVPIVLDEASITSIFERLFSDLDSCMLKTVASLSLPSPAAKTQLLTDLTYVESKLSGLSTGQAVVEGRMIDFAKRAHG